MFIACLLNVVVNSSHPRCTDLSQKPSATCVVSYMEDLQLALY